MKISISHFFYAVIVLSLFPRFSFAQTVVISANKSDISNYRLWLEGKECTDQFDYEHPLAYRETSELLILCKALHLGGLNPKIEIKEMPSYNRALAETRRGAVTIHGDTAWRSTISAENYHISRPFFKKEAFIKGLFVLPSRRDAIEDEIKNNLQKNVAIEKTIQAYTFTSSSGWVVDWRTLKQLRVKTINTPKKRTMCKLIIKEHADIMLSELTMINEIGFPFNCMGTYLVPIRGIKVAFEDSRHFIVSKRYPNNETIYQGLERGLELLEKNGEIARAMYPITTNRKMVKSWVNLTKDNL